MTKSKSTVVSDSNKLTQVKVTRSANAVASAIAGVLADVCHRYTNRAELVQLVEELPYPEPLPAGTENIFNMADVLMYSPIIPDKAKELGNYKVSQEWLDSRNYALSVLEGHKWSRINDFNNKIDCSNRLKTMSSLILGDALSGLRRALKLQCVTSFQIPVKPNKVFSDVDCCAITLFEAYAFDETLHRGKAKYWTFYLNFRERYGNCSSCGEIQISEILNELDMKLDSPSQDDRIRERVRDDDIER